MHDAGMFMASGFLDDLEQHAHSVTGQPMCVWGPAFPLRVHLQAPLRNAVITHQMAEFNSSMSVVRISVERLFGDIINYFKFHDFKKNLKIGLSPIGKMYRLSVLFCQMP